MEIKQLKLIFTIFFLISVCFADVSFSKVHGVILLTSGKVLLNARIAKKGDIVVYGDLISTKNKSACEIAISDDSIIKIKDNTEIIFQLTETKNSALKIMKGWFAGVFKNRKVNIVTPTIIAGIRGTAFCINVKNQKETYTCTCHGTIQWSGKKHEETVSAVHHTGRYYQIVNEKVVSTPVGPNYTGMPSHTDQTLEELAGRINTTIDWNEKCN